MRALFDTNILIDDAKGDVRARRELLTCDAAYVSRVVYIELLVGAPAGDLPVFRKQLSALTLLELDGAVADRSISVRKQYRRMKLPDAIIYATALEHGLTLITRNTREFNESMPGVRIPYTV